MKFCIINLGCKVNKVESDSFAAALLAQGHQASELAEAELVIINTCTVTGEAEKKTRKTTRQALTRAPQARVIVTGCAAALHAETFSSMDKRVEVVEKSRLFELLQQQNNVWLANKGFRTRVGVKVQDGCNNACTYCIVHVARGRATSISANHIVRECKALAEAGVKEIVLTGINLGSYYDDTFDTTSPLTLAGLLHLLLDETKDIHNDDEPPVRFRVSSIEPKDVDEAFIDLLASSQGRICRHLHLPLQSGSSKVLKEMARPYDAAYFAALVEKLYARVPQLSLSTDIIVGFPGETDQEFEETCELARVCRFSKIHVFPYSKREGTPAAQRLDQIDPEVKAVRAAQLRDIAQQLRQEDFKRRLNGSEWVLIEEGGIGMTESYHEVALKREYVSGKLVYVSLADEIDE
ncbi:MiaB/RimO family radical SAM methylthiotransferase [Adlercreutzia agrestimuris]|uniref:MiaB/RimO family radical SAM methylthiotransferase n=1 Tax=Adlercreutzia agrestimuris TaxID=2941324 RepID=UPI00203BF305|nr:MiaB/RimO family radical SAM methylthiotransferase [Adlercreutzia agrestimuris]